MRQNLGLRITMSAGALLLAAIHVLNPAAKIDSITIVLLVIGALPWLQPLIKSIELLGVKLELQELQGKVAEARGAAESASRQASLALSTSNAPLTSSPPQFTTAAVASADIKALAGEYERIRETQRSGDARTSAMTDVIRRMIEVARRTEMLNTRNALLDKSRGLRLFAYAYLYTRPDVQYLLELVESVTAKEDTPFGQYWGLQAIERVLAVTPDVPSEVKAKLRVFGAKLPSGTDRDYEVKKLLRELE
jgi:hypothetical protein